MNVPCEVGGVVQGDEGHVDGVAQVVSHGVIVEVGHQEEGQEEEVEKQGEVEGEGEKLKDHYTWMEWRWSERQVRAALSQMWSVMNDQTRTLKTACRCAQFCMLCMSMCVASFLLLSTVVSMMLNLW